MYIKLKQLNRICEEFQRQRRHMGKLSENLAGTADSLKDFSGWETAVYLLDQKAEEIRQEAETLGQMIRVLALTFSLYREAEQKIIDQYEGSRLPRDRTDPFLVWVPEPPDWMREVEGR